LTAKLHSLYVKESELGVSNFGKVRARHFTSDSATLCKTVISSREQNLNKQMAELGISVLFQYSTDILAKFNTFSRS